MVETLLGKDDFRYLSIRSGLFASSVKISDTPGPPIQCCVGAVVCAVEEIEKSTLFWGKGEKKCFQKAENRILLPSVSTLLSLIVVCLLYLVCSLHFVLTDCGIHFVVIQIVFT